MWIRNQWGMLINLANAVAITMEVNPITQLYEVIVYTTTAGTPAEMGNRWKVCTSANDSEVMAVLSGLSRHLEVTDP